MNGSHNLEWIGECGMQQHLCVIFCHWLTTLSYRHLCTYERSVKRKATAVWDAMCAHSTYIFLRGIDSAAIIDELAAFIAFCSLVLNGNEAINISNLFILAFLRNLTVSYFCFYIFDSIKYTKMGKMQI